MLLLTSQRLVTVQVYQQDKAQIVWGQLSPAVQEPDYRLLLSHFTVEIGDRLSKMRICIYKL